MYAEKNPYALNLSPYSTHALILEAIGKDQIVLDVGCNDGYIGKLADPSNQFYGLDYLPASVALAKKTYRDAIVYDLNTLTELPWKQKYDVIIFADVLEHLLYPEAVLNFFVKHSLKPGGRVIISLPNIANWMVRLKLLFGRFDYVDGSGIMDRTHLHLYTYASARQLAAQTGLTVLEQRSGANLFGPLIRASGGLLRNLLATGIILICQR